MGRREEELSVLDLGNVGVPRSNCCVTLSNLSNLSVLLLVILLCCSETPRGFCELTLRGSFMFPTEGTGRLLRVRTDTVFLIILKSLPSPSSAGELRMDMMEK